MRVIRHIFGKDEINYRADFSFQSQSTVHAGKTAGQVTTARYMKAAWFLLYPPVVVLSYKFWGLTAMCWATLIFFSFFAIRDLKVDSRSILRSLTAGSLLYVICLSATLLTKDHLFMQLIPSFLATSIAVWSAAIGFNLIEPRSDKDSKDKKNNPEIFGFTHKLLAMASLGLLAVSEWARRQLPIEEWVFFFAFVRIEFMIGAILLFIPAFAYFYHTRIHS
jgi:hypothetical protein